MFAGRIMSRGMNTTPFMPRLRWRKTWPDVADDFVAEAAGHPDPVGRIYRTVGSDETRRWAWSLTAFGAGIHRPAVSSGGAASPREAARDVEEAWFTATRATPA